MTCLNPHTSHAKTLPVTNIKSAESRTSYPSPYLPMNFSSKIVGPAIKRAKTKMAGFGN